MSEKRFDKIDDKMEELTDKISKLETTVSTGFTVYNHQLEIHIKGTNENRDEIKLVRAEIEPIKDHVKFIKTLVKLVFALGTLTGMLIALLEYLK